MKIGLPVDTLNQLESEIAANLKAAQAFIIVDSEDESIEVIDTRNGVCSALPNNLDIIIFSDGMGRGMFNGLKSKGVQIFQTQAVTVKEALEAFQAQQLETTQEVPCCGHGEHHHQTHGHDGGTCCHEGGGHGHHGDAHGGGHCGCH